MRQELNHRTIYAVLIDPRLRDRLRRHARERRKKVYQVLEEALIRYLEEADDAVEAEGLAAAADER